VIVQGYEEEMASEVTLVCEPLIALVIVQECKEEVAPEVTLV
jgi:hypothetical protein